MARLKMKSKEMSRQFVYFFLFFQSLCQMCHSLETVESHSQAFIQTDKHLTYIIGDVSSGIPIEVKPGQVYNDLVGSEDILLSNAIQLDPPMLDFQEQPVGMPRMAHVTVQNTDSKNNLHLLSISGSTAHFHCSFFQDKIVPPGGNTTFDVVFLARQEGNVENTLYIHTSLGSFKYQVFGVGVPNPYRLRPYIGARVPVNSSFAPLINMHNPHSSTLQVVEMYSSEGDLHLELPTGEKEAPRSLWEIPPYETKTIMKANFVGRTENNHTAFIRIKTNHRQDRQLLVLPMEVEVTSTPGVYVCHEMIDFGIVRTFDEPKTVPVNLINTGDTPVQISSVTVSPPNDAISVDFRPVKLHPELLRQTTVAHITFRASKALHPKMWSGRIIIRSKNNAHKISIPYEARVLHGSLTYHQNMTFFFSHKFPTNYSRVMTFTNTFNFSLVLFNVTLPPEISEIFSIVNFSKPIVLAPQQLISPFMLKFHPKTAMNHFRTKLTLHTNASTFLIDLIVYNGQLKIIPHRPEKFEGQLDFGTMGVKENKSVLFTLVNDNPIEIYVYEYSTDMKGATLQALGIEKGNGTTLSRQHNTTAINTVPLIVWPYHFAVFSLKLVAPEEEGSYQAEVIISTQFQETFMPVLVRTSEGSLHAIPEQVVFDKVFPGKIPMKVLQVHSTFHDYMELKSVTFQPPDTRFYFINARDEKEDIAQNRLLVLEPQTNNTIGRIYFDSKKECKEECYVGLPTYTPAGHQWLLGLHLDKEVVDTDPYLYTSLRHKWRRIQEEGKDRVNVTIEIDTSTVQGFLFSAHVHYHWPDIIRRCRNPTVKFPLTQIGNLSTVDIMVENTADIPVIVQILPLHRYPNPQVIVDLLKHDLPSYFSEYMETDNSDVFLLTELDVLNTKADNTMNKYRKFVDDTMGVKSSRDTITTFLNKGGKLKVQVGFKPKDDMLKTSLIIVRNNLTIIDAVVLEGQGGRGEMKLNNKKPGISSLQFDIAEKHLKHCDKRKHTKNMVPNFTVKRSFTLKNTGELPFYVHGYSINNALCEGYGFRVLDCEGYEMIPNTSRKIDIAFTPDFTMSRIQRVLTIYTSLGAPFNYTLQATVPPQSLSKCSASLPRPNWEPVLYYSIVCVMGFLLFCILVASYFEADRIFVADILKRKVKICNGAPYQKEKIFDLKTVAVTHNNSVSMTAAKPVSPSLVSKTPPRPIIEMSHREVEPKSSPPFSTTIMNIFKSFFVRKSPVIHKKPNNNNIEEDTPLMKSPSRTPDVADGGTTPQFKSSSNPDRDRPAIVADVINPEKSNVSHTQHKITLRRTSKAAKRSSHSDLTPSPDTPSTSSYDRKQGNKAQSGERKSSDQSTGKDKSSPNVTITDSAAGLASFDDVKVADIGKQKGGSKKKLRSRPERDSIVKDRLLQRQLDDKDETSSTTTESSTGDAEEKSSSATESTPDPPPPPKTKRARNNKSRHLDPLVIHRDAEDDINDKEFELTSKSRAYKKVKGQMYGEDVGKPSNLTQDADLSLPYSLENKKVKKKKVSPVTSKPEVTVKDKPKGVMVDLDSIDDITMDTAPPRSESDSPAPSWDEPHPAVSEDLSELALQTDLFAQKVNKSPGEAPPSGGGVASMSVFPQEDLTGSSRSSSYSSIVSSSSNGSNTSEGAKNKGDKQRYPVGFTPFSETIPAPITPKTPPVTSAGKLRSAWGAVPSSMPPNTDNVGFGLQTIPEANKPGAALNSTMSPAMFSQPTFSFATSVTSSGEDGYGYPGGYDQNSSSLTMMQRLRQDRRRRLMEHQRKVKGEDWPGFDMPLTTSESLWDTEYNPLDPNNTWSMTPETPVTTNSGLWSTLTNSANSSWNSLMGIWSSGNPATGPGDGLGVDPAFAPPNDAAAGSPGSPGSPAGGVAGPETVPVFNPFSTAIWSPSAPTTSSGWSPSAPTTSSGWSMPPSSPSGGIQSGKPDEK